MHWKGVIEEYREYLPVTEETPVITFGEGNTPLIYAEKLSLLTKLHIHTTPGIGFGKYGEGYIRVSLTSPDSVLLQAVKRFSYANPQ